MKGAVASAVAAILCYLIWSGGREWASGVRDAQPDAFLAGSVESVLALIAGVACMPVLLWAGMRALRERGTHLLVVAGTCVWFFLGGHVVEDAVDGAATALYLALFAVLGGALALVRTPGR
ncbi:hypothetical protein [Streptomyces fulvorobeus]|uniref:Uncharacterized protein n=1 Tax=Streptomyces fulvorobeus TaxID=284028 RepID=A0A7J0CAK6_9ACTN|nr:hypothetical protein [Streptomyces fulvorobeus]NYE42974.1 hypothetical protein [Streptomyces fulvorobeus]GFM99408.1 hypothetical protein Sfulv_42190 [Streptomyces fulvorobeus]